MGTGTYLCSTCSVPHAGPPTSYAHDAPVYWYLLSESDRDSRFVLEPELGILDSETYYVRGRIEIPIHGHAEPFVWVVWSSLSRENFQRTIDMWDSAGRESEPPYFGWLSSVLPGYPDTVRLKVNVHTQVVGLRPTFELEPTSHSLAVEQREGISWKRVEELASIILHQESER